MRRLESWFDPRLYAGVSAIHGRGVFTRAAFAVGEVVMRWGGVIVPRAEYRGDRFRARATTTYDAEHYLTVAIDAPATIDELLNHSCDPNTWMIDAVTSVARRPIAAGEEITIDAAMYLDDDHVHADPCRCGSSLCRGVVHGLDWGRAELQARYGGHFCTFLADRIRRGEAPATTSRR